MIAIENGGPAIHEHRLPDCTRQFFSANNFHLALRALTGQQYQSQNRPWPTIGRCEFIPITSKVFQVDGIQNNHRALFAEDTAKVLADGPGLQSCGCAF